MGSKTIGSVLIEQDEDRRRLTLLRAGVRLSPGERVNPVESAGGAVPRMRRDSESPYLMETLHAASFVHPQDRPRRRPGGRRGAGDRPCAGDHPLAHRLELPALARHDLRRRRGVRQEDRRDDRRQVPDLGPCRRRADAGVRRRRRRAERDRRGRPHRAVLLLRQGPGVRARLRDPVRPERAPDDGVDVRRQRPEADARVLRQVQHRQLPGRQHRRADGRLVPQGDQVGRRHEGPEVPHRRLRRQDHRAHRRRAAEHPRRRDLPGAREGNDRRRPSGSARTTT